MPVPPALLELINKFDHNLEEHTSSAFNEDTAKSQFIEPFFELLGWDVNNRAGKPEAWRDVLRQHSIPSGPTREAPDYIFKIGKTKVFILEAKKPSINIKSDQNAALQVRSYGWNSKLPIGILTNFLQFAVYDCRLRLKKGDSAEVGRVRFYLYKDYAEHWDDLSNIFSRAAVEGGQLDKFVESKKVKKGTLEVDEAFLREIEFWRKVLAGEIASRNPQLNQREVNFAVQATIDRIVFLRIAEDRGIESPAQLLGLTNGTRLYPRLFKLFENADDRYNSGLFHFREEKDRTTEPDRVTPELKISDDKLKTIIRSLYDNFYDFSLMPAEILGQIYERFLGNVIVLTEGHQAKVKEKPEVKKAGGVFYTPYYIVEFIVANTVENLLENKTPAAVAKLKILDPACGSGSFLLGAYQRLLDWHLEYYSCHEPEKRQRQIYPILGGFRLTTLEKKRILLNSIYGVDIDPQAVEVTKLSLLLKVLEGETEESLKQLKLIYKERALPDLDNNIKCGNSLVGTDLFNNHQINFLEEEDRYRINVFDWKSGFPEVFKKESPGFDAVIGNPPYVRQEGLGDTKAYFLAHYQTFCSTADLYINFIEKGLGLLNENGIFSMIVSNKWLRAAYGRGLREFLKKKASLHQIIDLAGLPVFSEATVRTIILLCSRPAKKQTSFRYLAPLSLEDFKTIHSGKDLAEFAKSRAVSLQLSSLTSEGWSLASASIMKLMNKIKQHSIPLKKYIKGEPYRGIITGLNEAFIIDEETRRQLLAQDSKIKGKGEPLFGIKTGLNEAFVIDEKTRKQLIAQDSKSKEIIKPVLTGRDVRRYYTEFNDKYLIWTYGGVPIEKYPAIFEHLKGFHKRLQKRWDKGKYWWELRACDYYDQFEKPKIIYPDIAKTCRFALDREGYFSTNTTYFIPGDDLYLLGILNSKLGEFIFKQYCAGLEGANSTYLRFFGQYLEEFPVRPLKPSVPSDKSFHARMSGSVEKIFELHDQMSGKCLDHEKTVLKRQLEGVDRQIDQLVYELYGLSEDEIKIVENESTES